MSSASGNEEFKVACCIRGYHVYNQIWTATMGEVLACEREPTNEQDRYAVAVLKSGTIVGHLPKGVFSLSTKGRKHHLHSSGWKTLFV